MSKLSSRTALLALVGIFGSSIFALYLVYRNFPEMKDSEKEFIKLPKNIDDAKQLGKVLSNYKTDNFMEVLCGVIVTYVFLQTFAIPGSIFLSIICGYLFPFAMALSLICTCSAIGASFCYLLSFLVGRPIARKYFAERVKNWAAQVQSHRDNLFYYILFLRITPFIPNWFINLASPLVEVPLLPFFVGTFFGVAPPSCVAVNAGSTLYELTSERDALSMKSLLLLAVSAIVAIVPVIFKQKLKKKVDKEL